MKTDTVNIEQKLKRILLDTTLIPGVGKQSQRTVLNLIMDRILVEALLQTRSKLAVVKYLNGV